VRVQSSSALLDRQKQTLQTFERLVWMSKKRYKLLVLPLAAVSTGAGVYLVWQNDPLTSFENRAYLMLFPIAFVLACICMTWSEKPVSVLRYMFYGVVYASWTNNIVSFDNLMITFHSWTQDLETFWTLVGGLLCHFATLFGGLAVSMFTQLDATAVRAKSARSWLIFVFVCNCGAFSCWYILSTSYELSSISMFPSLIASFWVLFWGYISGSAHAARASLLMVFVSGFWDFPLAVTLLSTDESADYRFLGSSGLLAFISSLCTCVCAFKVLDHHPKNSMEPYALDRLVSKSAQHLSCQHARISQQVF
jgi:hypothetical protein